MAETAVERGRAKLDWARSHMPIHAHLREIYGPEQPFQGLRVAVCSHVEAKTGVFIETLAAVGAEVIYTGSTPLSSQDDVMAALNEKPGIVGHMRHGVSEDELAAYHRQMLDYRPQFILDDAAELTARLTHERPQQLTDLIGMCEQTSTGVQRIQAMTREGVIDFPAYAVNDTPMKHDFDNVHGTGESTLTNLLLTTNLLMAGKHVVVAGFGYCGQGLAHKARGWGAQVTVTETDPRKALQAHMAGFAVAPMSEAASYGDFFITATGNREVLRGEHFQRMKDGVVLANAGHFEVEIAARELADLAGDQREVRAGITEYRLGDGRRINLVAGGQLANLATPTAMGHPAEVMDQTFAMQFMAAVHLLDHRDQLTPGMHRVPDEVDRRVAEIKLETLGLTIDSLLDRQRLYLEAWRIEEIRE